MSDERPFGVSVVIPARNESRYIRSCILSIIQGTSKDVPLEVLVVDGMSSDGTTAIVQELAKKYACVKLIRNEKLYTQHALNLGIHLATFSYVMIAGAHAVYPSQYIETLLEWLKQHDADGAGGVLQTVVSGNAPISHAIAAVLQCRLGVGNSMFRVGVEQPSVVDTIPFGLYPYRIFEEIGLYHWALRRNHDIEWSKRAGRMGKQFWLLPSLQCQYFARHTLKGLAKNNFQNGLWNVLTVFITRRLDSLSIRHYVPLLFVGGMIFLLLLALWWELTVTLFLSIFTLYLLLIALQSVILTKKHRNTTFFHLFLTFVVLHFSYGFGSLVGLVKGFPYLFRKTPKGNGGTSSY